MRCTTTAMIVLCLALACGVRPRTKVRSTEDARPLARPDTVHMAPLGRDISLPPYQLSFGDVVEFKFANSAEFNETVVIRPDGRISLEKIGEIAALGLTPLQLDSIVTVRYSRIIRRPDVTVMVREFGKRNVYVLGEVSQPGVYQIEDGMTILRAISRAGGYTDNANLSSVILMRNEYYRSPIAVRLDLMNFDEQLALDRDWLARPNDIVYLPRSFIGELNVFVDQFFSKLILPPFDAYWRYAITKNVSGR